jgi:hypothetical protein
MAARLECDVESGSPGLFASFFERKDFGVWTAESLVVSGRDRAAVAHHDSAHERVRFDEASALGCGGQSQTHPMVVIVVGDRLAHGRKLGIG